jgi:hypothetical protein
MLPSDEPLGQQDAERLSHGQLADAELGGEHLFAGQSLVGHPLPPLDAVAQSVGDLAVAREPRGDGGLEGTRALHGHIYARPQYSSYLLEA